MFLLLSVKALAAGIMRGMLNGEEICGRILT